MKKILLITMSIIMIFTCVACGEKATDSQGSNETVSADSESTQKDDNKTNEKYQTYEELPGTIWVNVTTAKYKISIPGTNSYRTRTGQYTGTKDYYVLCDQYLDITSKEKYSVDLSKIKSASDVIEGMKNQFLKVATSQLDQAADEFTYTIEETKDVKINGWDMCRTVGYFDLHDKFPEKLECTRAKFVAYTVIKEGYPIYFMAVDKTADQSKGEFIEEMADKIATTFRHNEE